MDLRLNLLLSICFYNTDVGVKEEAEPLKGITFFSKEATMCYLNVQNDVFFLEYQGIGLLNVTKCIFFLDQCSLHRFQIFVYYACNSQALACSHIVIIHYFLKNLMLCYSN